MVSADPIIVAAALPTNESTPLVAIISLRTASDALPDIGFIINKGIRSLSTPISLPSGLKTKVTSSIAPDFLKSPMAINIAIRGGIILTEDLRPSFAPSTKQS